MQTQTIQRIKISACILLAAAPMILAGCGSHNAGTNATSVSSPQEEQAIKQNAARQDAASRNMPMPSGH